MQTPFVDDGLRLDYILSVFSAPQDIPGNLRIQLVDYCNEKCFFCHNEGTEVKYRTLDEGIMWSVIHASAAIGKKSFRFTGGEPTLHRKFSGIVTKLRATYSDAVVGFTTNATQLKKLSPEVFQGGIDKINISLHSLDRSDYGRITGRDYLPKVLDNLDYLDSLRFSGVTINMVVDKNNIAGTEAICNLAIERGYELNILDIIGDASKRETSLGWDEINVRTEDLVRRKRVARIPLEMKAKRYHPKCTDCSSKSICGEGDYLRLAIPNKLAPCLYRPDLEQFIAIDEPEESLIKKVALGYRRIVYDDM